VGAKSGIRGDDAEYAPFHDARLDKKKKSLAEAGFLGSKHLADLIHAAPACGHDVRF
jgi:hypothetical protein